MTQTEDLLAARYGRKSGGRKVLVISFVAALVVVFFSFAVYASFIGKPVASVEVTSYEQLD